MERQNENKRKGTLKTENEKSDIKTILYERKLKCENKLNIIKKSYTYTKQFKEKLNNDSKTIHRLSKVKNEKEKKNEIKKENKRNSISDNKIVNEQSNIKIKTKKHFLKKVTKECITAPENCDCSFTAECSNQKSNTNLPKIANNDLNEKDINKNKDTRLKSAVKKILSLEEVTRDSKDDVLQICGPDKCNLKESLMPLGELLNQKSFRKLEKYDYTMLPWPVRKKYLEILKIYNFPFEFIGPFVDCQKQCKKKLQKRKNKNQHKKRNILFKDAAVEANELFTKVGYEDQLIMWLTRLFMVKPTEPHKYLKNTSIETNDEKLNSEYMAFLKELKNTLAFENELTFELDQIKLLCGTIDEDHYGLDGKPKEEYDKDLHRWQEKKINRKTRALNKEIKNVDEQIAEQKTIINSRLDENKQSKRTQTLLDLQMWKTFTPPTMENFIRDKTAKRDDGRIHDWFKCLKVPDSKKTKDLMDLSSISTQSPLSIDRESKNSSF